ncbi:MAG: hypothetical protein AMJ53_04930 [Gammaproteobacteria bacterium SG8_11]|nr:MAG: hypothetical protein AMJ53_04930 [Gammaproteobacteria bacterium SG8_11]
MALDEVVCPGCGETGSLIGKLQGSYLFAGVAYDNPLPSGYLYRCPKCFLKFRYPIQDADAYRRLYDVPLTSAWGAEASRKDWEKIVEYIHKTLPQGGKILDFGCYSGGLLKILGERYEKYGVEVNRSAADVAVNRGRTMIWQSLDEIPDELYFDAIVASDVVEHVPNPELLMSQLMQLLGKDGVLIATTGDADNPIWKIFGANWWYCFIAEHITFISKRWLDYYSREHQVKIVRFEKFRYVQLGMMRYLLDGALVLFYGIAPRLFLKMGKVAKKFLARGGKVSPTGPGISADHIFVVLTHRGRS